MTLQLIVLIGLLSPFVVLGLGWRKPRLRGLLALLAILYPLIALSILYGRTFTEQYARLPFLNIALTLRLTPLSWLFGVATATIGLLSLIYSLVYVREETKPDFYYFLYTLVHEGMIGVVLSGDFVTFYILWEIMSISTFLLISMQGHVAARRAGLVYILFSIGGSGAMLLALLSLYLTFGTVDIAAISAAMAKVNLGYALSMLMLFSVAFGIKNAVMPFHTWLPDAYAEATTPFSAVLSGMLTRMGVYGLLLAMYVIIGARMLTTFSFHGISYSIVLAWLGAITIVIPTFIALLQHDAKKLLAWHGIGQGGYMVLGIALGTSLGVAGGIFHTINHAIYIVLLFLVVGAVERATGGITDLEKLGGLARRMPVAFVGGLLGISGLIGMPLTNGFVSKWLIYKDLIVGGHPFLAFAALLGTWGTILSVFKFLHTMFLGRPSQPWNDIEPTPWAMKIPIIILGGLILLFGIFPGIPLKAIGLIEAQFGITPLTSTLFGVPPQIGELNMVNVLGGILAAGFLMYLIFSPTAKARRAGEFDTYTAGSPTPATRYNHAARFYDPLQKVIEPYLEDWFARFYSWIGEQSASLAETTRKLFSGDINAYALWIVILLGVLLTMGLLGWKP